MRDPEEIGKLGIDDAKIFFKKEDKSSKLILGMLAQITQVKCKYCEGIGHDVSKC